MDVLLLLRQIFGSYQGEGFQSSLKLEGVPDDDSRSFAKLGSILNEF